MDMVCLKISEEHEKWYKMLVDTWLVSNKRVNPIETETNHLFYQYSAEHPLKTTEPK